jgi:hypothetical protein
MPQHTQYTFPVEQLAKTALFAGGKGHRLRRDCSRPMN